jgi:hypothetical protein
VAAKGYKCDNGGERNKKQLGCEDDGREEQQRSKDKEVVRVKTEKNEGEDREEGG